MNYINTISLYIISYKYKDYFNNAKNKIKIK